MSDSYVKHNYSRLNVMYNAFICPAREREREIDRDRERERKNERELDC